LANFHQHKSAADDAAVLQCSTTPAPPVATHLCVCPERTGGRDRDIQIGQTHRTEDFFLFLFELLPPFYFLLSAYALKFQKERRNDVRVLKKKRGNKTKGEQEKRNGRYEKGGNFNLFREIGSRMDATHIRNCWASSASNVKTTCLAVRLFVPSSDKLHETKSI
jgi:hypothetical protein